MRPCLFFASCVLLISPSVTFAQTSDAAVEFERFQGSWRVTELVENGQVISDADFNRILPSGGRAEIVSNTIQFVSPTTKKAAKTFSVDPTVFPKSIVVSNLDKPEGWGIYQFKGETLVICMSDPARAQRPTDFSSRPGSQHMLMVLVRSDPIGKTKTATSPAAAAAPNTTPSTAAGKIELPPPPAAAPAATAATARVLTDAEVTRMLQGSWRLNDGIGVLQVSFDPNGSYRSYREVQNPSTFHKVFVQSPVAAGTWSMQKGRLAFYVTSSTDLNRVNTSYDVAVRSISEQDLIFVDSVGRVGKAVKLR